MMMKPKVLLVPFGDRYYPAELQQSFIDRCAQMMGGLGIELCVAPTVKVIGDAPAAACFAEEACADLTVALIATWMEPPNLFAALDPVLHKPLLLWSLVMYPNPDDKREMLTLGGFVAAATLRETLEEMDVAHKFIWGMPDDPQTQEAIASYARVALARRRLRETRVGLFGYASLGIYTATFDAVSLRRKIGPEIHHLDQWLLIKRLEEVPAAEAGAVADELTRDWRLGPNVTREELVKAGRMAVALRALAAENHLDAINIKCHYELSEIYQFTACVPISILSKDIVCSCEGDMFASMSQLMLHYLTGNQTVYGDIHEVFPPDRLTFACCGFNPIGMCDPKCRMISRWASDFQGIMNSSPYQSDQRVTLARMAAKGEDYKLHLTTGKTVETFNWHEINCPPPPATDVILDDDAVWFARNIASNHYAMVFGDVRQGMIDLADMLDVRVVAASRS
jgi:L-fucose isomerase-like protein